MDRWKFYMEQMLRLEELEETERLNHLKDEVIKMLQSENIYLKEKLRGHYSHEFRVWSFEHKIMHDFYREFEDTLNLLSLRFVGDDFMSQKIKSCLEILYFHKNSSK